MIATPWTATAPRCRHLSVGTSRRDL